MSIYQHLRVLHIEKLWFALNIILTLIYSINYHLSKNVSVNTFLTCVPNGLWFALNIMIDLSYICYLINNHLLKNVHIKTFFNHFYVYDFDIMNCWNTKSLLVNEVPFHLSLSRCSNGEPGNMHPCNPNVWIT